LFMMGRDDTRVCVIEDSGMSLTETFIKAHADHLPGHVKLITGWWPKDPEGMTYAPSIAGKIIARVRGYARPTVTAAYVKVLRRLRPEIVLAEYGPTGTQVAEACRRIGIPLVVHFHGYDASIRDIVEKNERYQLVAEVSAAVVAVSREMERRLIDFGVPRHKVHYNSYGVEVDRFGRSSPNLAPPVLLAVGRFTEKKAPHLAILAFSRVLARCPEARLRMVGDGPLFEICRDLVREMRLDQAVTLLGAQPHAVVQKEMQGARAFVQHSVEASNGDCEGTPVAILEAGASGLPVVSTRHAGIPDVVIEGKTGFLVDERDVCGMAEHMTRLCNEPALAAEIGGAAADHVRANYSMQQSICNLWQILTSCLRKPHPAE
jgi:glycosyltransferase involved in cell wall biosynthesis